jgi:sarcosine oxidase subunit gamma
MVDRGVTTAAASQLARYSLRTRTPDGLPAKVLSTAPFAGGTALCLGPDEWLLLLPEGAPPPAVAGVNALTDIGHRNVAIIVEGEHAASLLQTGCALDLALAAFPVGKATRTLYETVEIVLWRQAEDRFHVEVWRSFASYLQAALDLAAGDIEGRYAGA